MTDLRSPAAARRDDLVDSCVVLVATIVLLGGFAGLFEGVRWALDVVSVLVPVTVVAAAVRLWSPTWATPFGALTAVLLVVWVFVPGTTVLGVPTRGSWRGLIELSEDARRVIVEEVAPITPPDSVVLVVTVAFVVVLVLADAVARQAWRVPLLGLLWATMLVVPSVIAMEIAPWWVFAGSAAAWLWLWWSDTRHVGVVPTGAAVLTAGGAVVAALALPLVGPEVRPTSSSLGVTETTVFGRGINPMIDLGRNLRRSDVRQVLTYTTESTEGVYLKAATLRQFTGRTWAPSPMLMSADSEGVEQIADDIEVETIRTTVRIDDLRSSYLPIPYPATRVEGLTGDWEWLIDGGTVRATGRTTTRDQDYVVQSLDRRPTAEQARRSRTSGRGLDAYRNLPASVPEVVVSTARRVTAGATTDYDRMLRLQDWLRSEFTYSVEAPVEGGYDGNGLDVMAEFLSERAGYCVHFASTLAVMGRVLDVPTRIAVGYAPGTRLRTSARDGSTFRVDSDDLHAWTEVHLQDIGWVPFDATPGIGTGTEFAEEERPDAPQDAESAAPAPDEPSEQSTLTPEDDAATTAQDAESSSTWRSVLPAVVLIGLLGAAPGGLRVLRRRRRWGSASSEAWWREVGDTARDLGIEPDPVETPRRFAARLVEHGADPAALDRLVLEVEHGRYARTAVVEPRVDEARRVVDTLSATAPRRVRWLARIMPRSLLP